MRIGFVADVHVGNHRRFGGPVVAGLNYRCRQTIDALRRAVRQAEKARCDSLIVLGDLFDTSKPEPQIIAEVQDVLAKCPTILLLGNHEQVSTAARDHALGPLDPVASIIDRPVVVKLQGLELWAVPFQPGNARDWLPRALAEVQGDSDRALPSPAHRILALHLGLSDGDTAPWLKGALDSISAETLADLCRAHGIGFAFAGNWHNRKQFDFRAEKRGPLLTQVGALVPTGFDNPGREDYGGFAVYDSDTAEVQLLTISGPRFLKVRWRKGGPAHVFEPLDYVQLTADAADAQEANAFLEELTTEQRICAGEVVLEDAESAAAAKTAATVAKSAETLEQAVAGFVEAMPLLDTVDRASVLARVKAYLGRGN